MNHDYATEIRRVAVNATQIVAKLGLAKHSKRHGNRVVILCPMHRERTPSCNVRLGQDGTLHVHCFGCGWSGDVFTLVATCRGLNLRSEFKEVLAESARLVGLTDAFNELSQGVEFKLRALPPAPKPAPDKDYPPRREVSDLWAIANGGVTESCSLDPEACEELTLRRGVDAGDVDSRRLAAVISRFRDGLPRWAHVGKETALKPWSSTGYRMVVRAFDHRGELRSLRAWQIDKVTNAMRAKGKPFSGAKRIPPKGHRADSLVLANDNAQAMLRGELKPRRLLITEGEPDFVVAGVKWHNDCVLGIFSGSWDDGSVAKRIPDGCEVLVGVDSDEAGDRYADKIVESINERCPVRRTL